MQKTHMRLIAIAFLYLITSCATITQENDRSPKNPKNDKTLKLNKLKKTGKCLAIGISAGALTALSDKKLSNGCSCCENNQATSFSINSILAACDAAAEKDITSIIERAIIRTPAIIISNNVEDRSTLQMLIYATLFYDPVIKPALGKTWNYLMELSREFKQN